MYWRISPGKDRFFFLSLQPLIVHTSSSSRAFRDLPHLEFSLFWSCLGNYITGISWVHPSCHVQKELWSSRHLGLVVLRSLIQPLLSLLLLSTQYNGGFRSIPWGWAPHSQFFSRFGAVCAFL